MPPAAKRSASVVLFDVNTKPDFFERSRKCLLNICASKWFKGSNDFTKIILLNTAETNNPFARKYEKGFHISEVTDVINYNPQLIEPHLKAVKTGEGDWLLGLAVALEAIKDNYYQTKGVMTLQLLFISDFTHDVKAKEKSFSFIIDQLNAMNVYLYILGPEVKIPKLLVTYQDIQTWSKNIEFISGEDNPNLDIVKRIVSNTNGIVCGLDIGEELFQSYREHWGLQPQKVPLSIGSQITINCSTVRFLRKQAPPKLKAVTEEGYKEPWKWHTVEDINEVVPYDNVIGGVFKHNKFIPLPADVENNFKVKGDRSFKIIGFTNNSNISEFYMQGDHSSYIEKNDSGDSRLFDLLLNTLAEQNKCAIARRVYMANCKPRLMALLPRIEERKFLLVELPYKEAINTNLKEQNIDQAIKLEVDQDPAIDAVYNYLQKLDITEPSNCDQNGSVKWPLSAELMCDPKLKVVNQRCLKKYLDESAIITSEPDISVPRFVEDIATLKQFIPPVAESDV